MKRLLSMFIATSMLCSAVITAGAVDVSYMADFEEAATRFGKSTVYAGFKNSAGDYKDFITPAFAAGEGKDGSTGLEINYKAATWYAGEIFFPIPSSWGNGSGAEYLNFDYKGTGTIKINLSTGSTSNDTLTTGTRYGYRFTANTNGSWESISIPLSSFVNGTTPVTITEIGSVTFQAGESANLNNNAAETKAMSASELEAVAKAGSIVLDNMELSSKGDNAGQPSQTTAPTEAPDTTTRVIDFDDYSLNQKQTWAGFKNDAADYTDFIKSEITDQGKAGKGFKLTYNAATWYSGEVFCAIPKEWAVNKTSSYLEFDAKGRGIIKIALETGEVVNGKRYEQRVYIDTNGEWQKFSIPLSVMKNGDETVPLQNVTGMTFKAAESGNLNNNDAATKAMTKSELEAAAKKGEVIIDNITLSENYTAQPNVTVTISQNSRVVSSASDIDPDGGKVKISAAVSNCTAAQDAVLAVAIYNNGILDNVKLAGDTIDYSGTVEVTVNAAELTGKTMKVFVLDSLRTIKPLTIPVMF